MKAISLFSSSGIGDLALESNNIRVLLANELIEDRARLFKSNFPKAKVLCGDVWKMQDKIISEARGLLGGQELDFILATPPCQGMSKNGQGKLLSGVRKGLKPKIDARNRLIIPTMNIICALQPRTVVFENVTEMKNTVIDDENGRYINILDYIRARLDGGYEGKAEIVEFADYGVPQRRKRLITIFTKDQKLKEKLSKHASLLPSPTHSADPSPPQKRWVSLGDVIRKLPVLDAKSEDLATSDIEFHYVSVLEPKKYHWIANTPPEKGAFDNQCINPECLFTGNKAHGSRPDHQGINKANGDTPLYCERCGSLLPRPYTIDQETGKKRIMKGYTSAYKRMKWDLPSSTLTTNLSYPSSDHKLHPQQNRVLSLYEAFRLHTLDRYGYKWYFADGKRASDSLIRESIGESVPPLGLEVIFANLIT